MRSSRSFSNFSSALIWAFAIFRRALASSLVSFISAFERDFVELRVG